MSPPNSAAPPHLRVCSPSPSCLPLPNAAGLEQFACVDETLLMYQYVLPDNATATLNYGGNNTSGSTFQLTAQTTNLARVTLTGIVSKVGMDKSRQKQALKTLAPTFDTVDRPHPHSRSASERLLASLMLQLLATGLVAGLPSHAVGTVSTICSADVPPPTDTRFLLLPQPVFTLLSAIGRSWASTRTSSSCGARPSNRSGIGSRPDSSSPTRRPRSRPRSSPEYWCAHNFSNAGTLRWPISCAKPPAPAPLVEFRGLHGDLPSATDGSNPLMCWQAASARSPAQCSAG